MSNIEYKARLTFMGTGTSQGVPIIGCKCRVCSSADERDKRFRSSALVDYRGLRILVDAGPDFRSQMLRAGVSHLDAIFITHNHKDHTGGLDDIRSLNYIDRRAAEIYCEENVLRGLETEYPYAFEYPKYPGAPEWHMHIIGEKPFIAKPSSNDKILTWVHDVGYCYELPDGSTVPVGDQNIDHAETVDNSVNPCPFDAAEEGQAVIIPIRGYHDKLPVLGFRFGNIAYITDMSSIPESEFVKLEGLDHLTLNTVGYKPHHSHFSLDEALDLADRIGAGHTWLTHLSHSFPRHEEFCRQLRELCSSRGIRSDVQPAYDGLTIG